MREIKFRVWDKKTNKFVCNEFNLYEVITTTGLRACDCSIDIQQYTGLKDNTSWEKLSKVEQEAWLNSGNTKESWNGKEIYEGDIVKATTTGWETNKTAIDVVIFEEGVFGILDKFSCSNDIIKLGGLDVEVIGTIYENPELLHD